MYAEESGYISLKSKYMGIYLHIYVYTYIYIWSFMISWFSTYLQSWLKTSQDRLKKASILHALGAPRSPTVLGGPGYVEPDHEAGCMRP